MSCRMYSGEHKRQIIVERKEQNFEGFVLENTENICLDICQVHFNLVD